MQNAETQLGNIAMVRTVSLCVIITIWCVAMLTFGYLIKRRRIYTSLAYISSPSYTLSIGHYGRQNPNPGLEKVTNFMGEVRGVRVYDFYGGYLCGMRDKWYAPFKIAECLKNSDCWEMHNHRSENVPHVVHPNDLRHLHPCGIYLVGPDPEVAISAAVRSLFNQNGRSKFKNSKVVALARGTDKVVKHSVGYRCERVEIKTCITSDKKTFDKLMHLKISLDQRWSSVQMVFVKNMRELEKIIRDDMEAEEIYEIPHQEKV